MWLLIVFFTENFRLLSHFTFYEHCKDRYFFESTTKILKKNSTFLCNM
jgi:hypothetical protein